MLCVDELTLELGDEVAYWKDTAHPGEVVAVAVDRVYVHWPDFGDVCYRAGSMWSIILFRKGGRHKK